MITLGRILKQLDTAEYVALIMLALDRILKELNSVECVAWKL